MSTSSYTYRTSGDSTSALVSSYSVAQGNRSVTYDYTYDDSGNIIKVVTTTAVGNTSTSTETRYVYDNLSQLIREDNGKLGKTYTYTYDNAGNITSKKTYALTAASATPTNPTATQTYGYADEDWGDLLTSRNGVTVTYDSLGNPMHYNRFDLIWEGRKLVRAISDDAEDYGYNDLEYEYNDEGLLIGKTELYLPYYHEFYYDGDRMIAEVWESEALFFLYDSTGVIGMQYWYETELIGTYWFEKNLQGDVVAVYDNAGVLQISYDYDAWGNFTQTRHVSSTYANLNPFRYRGYYYDYELEMYYLQSRYYDPEVGRFISPDKHEVLGATPTELTDKNLYAYCNNNPVAYVDTTGEFPWNIVIGAAIGFVGGVIDQAISGDWSLNAWIKTGVATVEGAITAVVGPAAGAIISGVSGGITSAISGNDDNQIAIDALASASISLLGSGAQLGVGEVLAENFIEQASKTKLKHFANSLGYVGRNFKSAESWSGKIMFDAAKSYMDATAAKIIGSVMSFITARTYNALFS